MATNNNRNNNRNSNQTSSSKNRNTTSNSAKTKLIPTDGFTTTFLWVCILSISAFIGYQLIAKSNILPAAKNITFIPKKVDVIYKDATFKYELDDQNTLAILENPFRYKREFLELVHKYNLSVLSHLSVRMNLQDSISTLLPSIYEDYHNNIANMIYNDYTKLKNVSQIDAASWYQRNANNSVEYFNEVISKYTCHIVNQSLTGAFEITNGSFMAVGSNVNTPCGIAMTESLKPTIDRLKKVAAIEDFSRSKGFLKEKLTTTIAELATLEIKDKKGITRTLDTKIWRYSVSSTDIDISAISILKIGFDLNKNLDIKISTSKKKIQIILPEPEILSHELFPKVEKLNVGWLRELTSDVINSNINQLREVFLADAKKDNAFSKAKRRAQVVIGIMLDPLIATLGDNYQLIFKFKNNEITAKY